MKRLIVFAVLSTPFAGPAYGQGTITVDLNGGGDFTDIQTAIDEAEDGDTVLVAPGEYVISEAINFNAPLGEEEPVRPNVKNIVLRSEMGPEKTIVRMIATPADRDRASVVMFENNETDESILDGFTLTQGLGSTLFGHSTGGGVYCRNESSPRIQNCIISRNTAQFGGGVYCGNRSSATLINCRISENAADFGGGFHGSANSTPVFSRCVIARNAARSGGGVECSDASKANFINPHSPAASASAVSPT